MDLGSFRLSYSCFLGVQSRFGIRLSQARCRRTCLRQLLSPRQSLGGRWRALGLVHGSRVGVL